MSSTMTDKQKSFLMTLTRERAAVQYKFGKQLGENDFEAMSRSIDLLGKIDDEIQKIVGCSCQHQGGGSECGGMELDEDTDELVGRSCLCVCHDCIMYRLTPEQKATVDAETFRYIALTILRVFHDDWQEPWE